MKNSGPSQLLEDLCAVLTAAQPRVVYTHNLFDRHDTHIAVALRTIEALRSMRAEVQPVEFYGCEVWRDLDWLANEDKIALPVDRHPNIAAALLGVHDTQNSGGKRIDQATLGRRLAHASYGASHAVDRTSALVYATDLMPLIRDPQLNPIDYAAGLIDRFKSEVSARIGRVQ